MRRIAFVLAAAAITFAAATASAGESWSQLADKYWDEELAHDPASATAAGVHTYDDRVRDFSPAALQKFAARQHEWLKIFDGVDVKSLSRDEAIDLQLLRLSARGQLVEYELRRGWQRLPRIYSSEALNGVYLIVKRNFAPAAERLKSVIAREEQVPQLVANARLNLKDPARINVELALEELPSSIDFLKKDTVDAFAAVKDPALRQRFAASTDKATRALAEYGDWLKKTLLPKAQRDFAVGRDTFVQLLAADEGIDTPLDQVLAQGEAELARLHDQFVATAKQIDPSKPAVEVQASLSAEHGAPATLLADVNGRLAGLRKFLVDKNIVTIPSPVMPIVQESPPFMRAFTLASMDTPGPYETHATEAYYNVTLPDPSWTKAQIEDYMRGAFSKRVIELTSIHEAFPGHYTQFLWMPQMPTRTRKLYSCASNAEGWAHYAEQMIVDEGVANGDPKLRLAQLQEALLRAARYVVGIRMHTRGMTLEQAMDLFVKQGMQSHKVAEMEAKRGTEDPTYLYYTWGKLQILKLREDYKKKLGAQYSLRKFHDAFLGLGSIPLPILRQALLE